MTAVVVEQNVTTVIVESDGGVAVVAHHGQAHAHDGADGSGTVAHGDTTGQGSDDHHAEVHAHTHAATTGQTVDDHHARDHAATHQVGGADYFSGALGWDDMRVPVTATKGGGVRDPDFVQWRDDGAGSTGVYSYAFDATNEEELFFVAQLPHGYDIGTDLEPHVHWGVNTVTAVGTVIWGVEYTLAIPVTGNFGVTSILEATYTFAGAVQYDHLILDLGMIAGAPIGLSSFIIGRVYRKAGTDTFADDAFLHEIDFHYQSDTLHSTAEFVK